MNITDLCQNYSFIIKQHILNSQKDAIQVFNDLIALDQRFVKEVELETFSKQIQQRILDTYRELQHLCDLKTLFRFKSDDLTFYYFVRINFDTSALDLYLINEFGITYRISSFNQYQYEDLKTYFYRCLFDRHLRSDYIPRFHFAEG